jgi:V8-like Glu-specific endopeptidase
MGLMSDKPRRRVCVAAVAATLLLTPAAADAAPAVLEAGDSGRTAAEVRRYWTPKRMENAKPVKLLVDGTPAADESGGTRASREDSIPFTSGEFTDPETLAFPNRVHGKVFFTRPGSGNFVCSGTAVEANNLSTVITAGHCVYSQGVWSTNFEFVPAYPNEDSDGNPSYGEWAATEELAPTQWVSSGNFSFDVGAAVVAENGSGQALQEVVGARGILFNQPVSGPVRSHGYPALAPFDGSKLRYCDSNLGSRDPASSAPQTMGIGCDMNGGSSGGGWVIAAGANGSVISVNSYTYAGPPDVMYGPYFGSVAQALYNAAQGDAPGGPATPAAGGLTTLLQSLRTDAPTKKCKKHKKRTGIKKRKKRCKGYR